MKRFLLGIAALLALTACEAAQPVTAPQKSAIRTVAIVSGLADRVQLNFAPLGLFTAADAQWVSVDWKLDELATGFIADRLKAKYEIRTVSYRPADLFLAPGGVGTTNYGRIGQEMSGQIVSDAERIKRGVPAGAADAIIYIGHDSKRMGFDSPLYVRGLGYTRQNRLGNAINLAHAGYRIVVLDGRSFDVIGQATVDGPVEFYARNVSFYLQSSGGEQNPVLMNRLREQIVSMLRSSMPTTLAQVGFQ